MLYQYTHAFIFDKRKLKNETKKIKIKKHKHTIAGEIDNSGKNTTLKDNNIFLKEEERKNKQNYEYTIGTAHTHSVFSFVYRLEHDMNNKINKNR